MQLNFLGSKKSYSEYFRIEERRKLFFVNEEL